MEIGEFMETSHNSERSVQPRVNIFTANDVERFFQQHEDKVHTIEGFLLNHDPVSLVQNFKTESIVIGKGEKALLATINSKEYGNTHICSPYNVYIGYAKSSAKHFDQAWIRALIYSFTTIFGSLFKLFQFNKVIQLNNTLATVNIHPRDVHDFLPDVLEVLIERYPHHAILWPRINLMTDSQLYEELKKHEFTIIPTKTVHLYDVTKNYMRIKTTKRDFSVLKQSQYKIVQHDELTDADMDRIHELYEMLFIKKHSEFNPNFTQKYFRYAHRSRWFEFTALRSPEGVIDAFCSQTKLHDVMVCGPSGYDTSKPAKLGLYRMIIWLNLDKAFREKCLYNMGSGNELYKLNRGSIREIEYNAVYYRHLPLYRRIPWQILAWAGRKISMKILAKNFL